MVRLAQRLLVVGMLTLVGALGPAQAETPAPRITTSGHGAHKNGKKHGLWTYWYVPPTAGIASNQHRKESEGHYDSGVKVGLWTYWHRYGHRDRMSAPLRWQVEQQLLQERTDGGDLSAVQVRRAPAG